MNHQHRRIMREYQVQYDERRIILRPRYNVRRRTREVIQRALFPITVAFLLSVGFSGVGALGCWGLEIITANSNPMSISQYQWQARKNVCLEGMLVGLSGFLGSALLGACVGGSDQELHKED